jgi:hypothetical protein
VVGGGTFFSWEISREQKHAGRRQVAAAANAAGVTRMLEEKLSVKCQNIVLTVYGAIYV